ncbi:MAG: LamG-like jellyroll fold domain-containing protein [Polyangiaceae bacterium]|nr:LamG-like jellyroll fold domain-containing protein [Polyangiaceae bacterium]
MSSSWLVLGCALAGSGAWSCGVNELQTFETGPASAPTAVKASLPTGTCSRVEPESDTVSLFSFEDFAAGAVRDEMGHAALGNVIGSAVAKVQGPGGCGQALAFGAENSDSYLTVPNTPLWDLSEGSLDFWLRPEACLPDWHLGQGIVGRDASFQELPGQMRMLIKGGCKLEVRVQGGGAEQCLLLHPDSLPLGVWTHVGLNFGGGSFDLEINGTSVYCSGNWSLAGNANRLIIGGNPEWSSEINTLPIQFTAQSVAIDEVRISSARRTHWY